MAIGKDLAYSGDNWIYLTAASLRGSRINPILPLIVHSSMRRGLSSGGKASAIASDG